MPVLGRSATWHCAPAAHRDQPLHVARPPARARSRAASASAWLAPAVLRQARCWDMHQTAPLPPSERGSSPRGLQNQAQAGQPFGPRWTAVARRVLQKLMDGLHSRLRAPLHLLEQACAKEADASPPCIASPPCDIPRTVVRRRDVPASCCRPSAEAFALAHCLRLCHLGRTRAAKNAAGTWTRLCSQWQSSRSDCLCGIASAAPAAFRRASTA